MYFSPKIHDTNVQVRVYESNGNELLDFASSTIVALSIGYYIGDSYYAVKTLTSLVTLLDPSTLDIDNLYCQIVTAATSEILKVENLITTNILRYNFRYTVAKHPIKHTNMLIDRCNYFMPRWSAAYKNDLSTFNKVYYPVFEQLEKALTRSYTTLSTNLAGKPPAYHTIFLRKTPLTVVDTDTNTKLEEVFNIDTAIIDKASTQPIVAGTLIQGDIDSLGYPLTLTESAPYIFAKKLTPGTSTIYIEGLNQRKHYIQEALNVNATEHSRSLAAFSEVFLITSSDTDISISTYIDCVADLSFKARDSLKLLVDADKNFSSGFKMGLVDNVLEIKAGTFGSELPLYRYTLNAPFTSADNSDYNLFITPQNNLILLYNNEVYSGVLSKPLDSEARTQDVIDNAVVFVECDEDTVGKPFTFVIDFKEYAKEFLNNDFYIKLQTNGEVKYLNQAKQFQSELVMYSNENASKLYLDLTLEADKTYVLSLMDTGSIYSAIMRADSVTFTKILPSTGETFSSMYHNGTHLVLRSNTADYKLVFDKRYYEWCPSQSTLYLQNNVKNIEVVYTDFSKDLLVI